MLLTPVKILSGLKFRCVLNFVGVLERRKYFNAKIEQTKVSAAENFPIYGIYVLYKTVCAHDISCTPSTHPCPPLQAGQAGLPACCGASDRLDREALAEQPP